MFVSRTRLVQYADLVGGVQTVITPVVAWTSVPGVAIQAIADVVAAMPTGQRPIQADWWKYRVEWLVQSHVLPTFRGVVPNTGRLVFDVACWDTAAAQQASQPPLRQNTFIHEFTSKRLAGSAQEIRASVDDYLLRAEFGGYPADARDPRIVTTTAPAQDPLGLLTRPAIQAMDGVYRTLAATWRTA